jgi:hypothetical protein
MTWWTSHHPAGIEHPGMMQPPSRPMIALRWVAVKQR